MFSIQSIPIYQVRLNRITTAHYLCAGIIRRVHNTNVVWKKYGTGSPTHSCLIDCLRRIMASYETRFAFRSSVVVFSGTLVIYLWYAAVHIYRTDARTEARPIYYPVCLYRV